MNFDLSQLSIVSLIASGLFFAALLSAIFSWVKRLKVSTCSEKTAVLEKRLIETPPETERGEINKQISEIEAKISAGKEVLRSLEEDVIDIAKNVEMVKSGLYPPTFGYLDSEDLKKSVRSTRVDQLELIKNDSAVTGIEVSLFDSKKDGAALLADYKKVFLRTFNAEFEDIRKKLRMSNLDSSVEKLHRVSDRLSNLGEALGVRISKEYFDAKVRELDAWGDELKKRNEAKEQRKEQKRLLREQKKEFKKDDEELEAEIEASAAMLSKAKKRALELVGMTDKDVLYELRSLEEEIADYEAKIEESMSEAQKTKAGYIYVISNMGSFGKDVLKIGMTRRLEPIDRVVELGDASVPYKFDVHTIAFVENAPDVERMLHRHFEKCRVNKENERKEFFAVPLEDVREKMKSLEIDSEWYYEAEAREFNESELMRSARSTLASQAIETIYPEAI